MTGLSPETSWGSVWLISLVWVREWSQRKVDLHLQMFRTAQTDIKNWDGRKSDQESKPHLCLHHQKFIRTQLILLLLFSVMYAVELFINDPEYADNNTEPPSPYLSGILLWTSRCSSRSNHQDAPRRFGEQMWECSSVRDARSVSKARERLLFSPLPRLPLKVPRTLAQVVWEVHLDRIALQKRHRGGAELNLTAAPAAVCWRLKDAGACSSRTRRRRNGGCAQMLSVRKKSSEKIISFVSEQKTGWWIVLNLQYTACDSGIGYPLFWRLFPETMGFV